MTNRPREKQNIIVNLRELGPAVAGVEFATSDIPAAVGKRPARKGPFIVLGAVAVIVVCVLAGAQYALRRIPVKASAPTIKASAVTTTSATISWSTERPSSSQVEFGTTPAYGSLSAFSSPLVTSHSLVLTGLVPGTTYDYATLSTSDTGQVDTSANFTFTTASVDGSSMISHVTAGGITSTSATITWITRQPFTSQVEFGPTTAYGSLSAFSSAMVTSHSVVLTGLTPGTVYDYAALSTNAAGQISTSGNFTFTTTGVGGAPVISGVTAGDFTPTSAKITWTTDQPFTSQVEFGPTQAYGSLSAFGSAPTTSHAVTLTGLTPGTTYYYAALSTNSAGQTSTSANFTFTTTSAAGSTAISGVTASAITATSATIGWTTDQPSASQVEYGTTPAHGSLSAFNSAIAKSHSVVLTGLTPRTTYNYAALSANSTGQVGKSDNFSFTTLAAPPVITQLTANGVTSTSATIAWTTDQPATSQMAYGTTTAYGSLSAPNSALVTSHSVTLSGLTPGTTYHCAAMSTNSTGMQNSSHDLKFTTPAGRARLEIGWPYSGVGRAAALLDATLMDGRP